MFKKIFFSSIFAAAMCASLVAQAQLKYLPGRDYQILQQPLEEEKAQSPKAIEFFWYGCPHCYHFEKPLQKWLTSEKPANLTFEKVPAVTQYWQLGAELYYTAHALNLPHIDEKIFEAVHKYNNKAIILNKEKAIDFLVANGADKNKVERVWNSLATKQKVARAKALFDQSGLNGVPSMLVNGTYTVSARDDYDQFLDTVSALSRQLGN